MLLKPEELVMYRPAFYGGLGVLNVKQKAQAGLIKSFTETAANNECILCLFHSILYRYHVLGETSLPNLAFPPFYNRYFFKKIRQVHQDTPLKICNMSEKEW